MPKIATPASSRMRSDGYVSVIALFLCMSAVSVPAQDFERKSARQVIRERIAQSRGSLESPETVGIEAIPTYEQLSLKFKEARKILKPAFFANTIPHRSKDLLDSWGCTEQDTLPSGIEYKPDHLDGYITLFRCSNGDYGRISFEQEMGSRSVKIKRAVAPEAINSNIAGFPAAGRARKSVEGVQHTNWRWNSDGGSISFELISTAAVSLANSRAAAANAVNTSKYLAEQISEAHGVKAVAP
jgi:hypothetical protein